MFLLSSCYTQYYTCLLYYCQKKNIYNIYVYQNSLDYKSENISLKPIQLIQLEHSYKAKDIVITKSDRTGQSVININVKIYFGADNYILLNEVDRRILLIDFINGNYITIFNNKELKSQEPIYNIIDSYDENYLLDGELRIRTYAFLSIKYQEKKQTYYKYRYFIIERGILENNYFFLHSIDLDMGNGEPLGIKISKIPKQIPPNAQGEEKIPQWFYIFCFLSSQKLFQLITNYDKLTLYQMLRNISQCNTIIVPSIGNLKLSKYSMTTIGLKKDPLKINLEDNNEKNNNDKTNKINNNDKNNNEPNNNSNANFSSIKNPKQICFWSTSVNLWLEKKQVAQSVKIFLNINTKRLCALILFFEIGEVITFPFNYNDSPEEIKNKITVTTHEIQLDKIKTDSFGPLAKVYKFEEHYFFKSNTICALTSKNLILAIDNKFRIYDLETNASLYSYNFYKENIAAFLLFDDIGATFLLTWTKVFKVIFNSRYDIFSENEIKNNPKSKVNPYQPESMNYPTFELIPEDIWNSYCNKLEIDSLDNKKYLFKDPKINTVQNLQQSNNNKNNENEQIKKKVCVICSKEAEYYCSNCELKFYCCNEHFIYDYNNIHFFECQLVQFFRRKDIMSIEDKEIRYIVLYNELIKLCGRILNFMFTRIFVGKDCHIFLQMLLNLITLLDNFGFGVNFAEFCSCNLLPSTDKNRPRSEKILFFQECIYFYVQLQILKCTFTSKCKLYNLTDCYLKIIKNDIIPKLTPKSKKKIIPLRCSSIKKELIFQNKFFQNFQSPVFFDLKKVYINAECTDIVDIVENYIMKHLMALSILVKFKIKLHSSIDVKDTFVDISLMFDDHFREIKTYKNVAPYCYFSISFYLVEIGKVPQTVKLLKKMVSSFNEKSDTKLKALTFYNLGVLQYALGEFKIGIHNIEVAYKLIVDFFLSEKFKYKVMVSLGLAYLNQRNLFKAYVLIQTSIRELKKIRKQKYELKCIKLNVYLNYIIDLYEYSFITKARLQSNKTKKDKNFNIHQLINFVQGEKDKELIVIEQHVTEFLKVVEYIWNLPNHILQQLQVDNPPKPTINYREEVHHEKNLSFTMEKSQMSTFLIRETGIEKEESQEEYDEDIEVKPSLFDSLTRQQQKDFKELKTVFLKRDIILRDSLGAIEKFNINYNPVYSLQFQKIIEKLKSNFLLKDIFYCFQNEKWRDELYNYNSNSLLFGLSKYLKLEKIKNVIAIEKSKCLDIIKKEKIDLSKDSKSINNYSLVETDLLKKINIENNIYPNNNLQNINTLNMQVNTFQNSNNLPLFSRYKNEEMNYLQFKKKFYDALKENEKNKNDEKFQFYNLKDDYLVSLYKNVYLNNPEHDFIFQNPSLILNYIFIDISNNDTSKKEANELIMKQKIQEDEINNKLKNRKSGSFFLNKNSEVIKEEESFNNHVNLRYSSTFKNINHNNGTKDINEIFDKKSKVIISPILENLYDLNNYNKTSSETQRIETYVYLKFDIIKDNLQKVKESEHYYIFVRKKLRSATANWGGKFIFGKKKKGSERKSCLPDLFIRFSNSKKYTKGDSNKKVLSATDNRQIIGNRKSSMIIEPSKISKIGNNKNNISNLKNLKNKKKKKEKSCNNLHERLSINFNLDMDDIIGENNLKLESSLESDDISQIKSSNENIDENNSFKEINKEKEENNINDENKKNEIENHLKDKPNNPINNIYNNLMNENNENNTQINNEKDNNNKIIKLYDDNFNNIINCNKDEIRNIDSKSTRNDLIKKNNNKLFNNSKYMFPLNKNNNNKKLYKNLTINTKKSLYKPKTYNYFSPEQLRKEKEEDDNINNFYGNKKISFYSMSQKKLNNKNYGFKNKKEQETEIIIGAIEYLQQECNNKNKRNIKGNHIINSSGVTMTSLKYKYKFNENQINNGHKNRNNYYKVPYDYKKKGKLFGEESTISLNSTSSGLYILNNNYSYYDDESSHKRNNFEEEMVRIMNYNKNMNNNGKKNRKNSFIINIKMKNSESQPNFFDKKNLKIFENDDKTMYSKGKSLAKTNKTIKPILNIFTKCLDKTTNTGISTSKNINLNGKDINSFNNNNYSKFNIKSNHNQKSNKSNTNIRLNKENKEKFYGDFQEQKINNQNVKRKENKKSCQNKNEESIKKDYINKNKNTNTNKINNTKKKNLIKYKIKNNNIRENKKETIKEIKNEIKIEMKNIINKEEDYNNEQDNNNFKFRFVLDKFIKSRNNKKLNKENSKKKEEENNKNNNIYIYSSKQGKKETEKENEKEGFTYKIGNEELENVKENNKKNNYKSESYEINDNGKKDNCFLDERINFSDLSELKDNNENNQKTLDINKDIEILNKNDKIQNHNISNIKQNQDNNSFLKNSNEIINENKDIKMNSNINIENNENKSNNNLNKIYDKNLLENNGSNKDKIENISFESSSNGLGEDTNIEHKINLPVNIAPNIKNNYNLNYINNNIKNDIQIINENYLNDSNSNGQNKSEIKNKKI